MDAKKIALLVGALVVAGITAFLAKSMFASQPVAVAQATMPAAQVTGPEILVATRSLPVGTIIAPDSFRFQPWPNEMIQDAYYVRGEVDASLSPPSSGPAGGAPVGPAGPADPNVPASPGGAPAAAAAPAPSTPVDPNMLAGTVVRMAIAAGQPLTKGALVQPGDRGFLAAALGPGMRAISVPVDGRTGVSGFIFPGDRVDVVLSQTVSGTDDDGPPLKAAETIVRNVRVLATDQRTVAEDAEGKREVKTFALITLEVTPRIAEKVVVAQAIGQLSLALRSIADNSAELERAIASGEVKVPEGTDPKAEKRMLLQVASRPLDGDSTFSVGGDVSRFQRRTIPRNKVQAPQNGGANFSSGSRSAQMPSSSSPDPVRQTGPVVRIARGNNVTEVPVGGK